MLSHTCEGANPYSVCLFHWFECHGMEIPMRWRENIQPPFRCWINDDVRQRSNDDAATGCMRFSRT